MKTSRGLHKVAQEQVQRTGAALVCHQGINAQASVKQLFSMLNNLMRGNVFHQALHLTPLSLKLASVLNVFNDGLGQEGDVPVHPGSAHRTV